MLCDKRSDAVPWVRLTERSSDQQGYADAAAVIYIGKRAKVVILMKRRGVESEILR
jgi:hypothetical protein